jgi:hypothetical protein
VRAADELQAPVGYDDRWVVLAVLALALMAVYYAAVLWWGRSRPDRPARSVPRAECLGQLEKIGTAVSAGRVSPREGHQRISATVRHFVSAASGVPAHTMTLADIEREGPEDLAEIVALVYPPEFAPGDDLARERFGTALERARELVTTWS